MKNKRRCRLAKAFRSTADLRLTSILDTNFEAENCGSIFDWNTSEKTSFEHSVVVTTLVVSGLVIVVVGSFKEGSVTRPGQDE